MTGLSSTAAWLESQGLAHLCGRLGSLSLERLQALMISDYASLGVTSMSDKQKLFKALQSAGRGTGAPTPPLVSPQLTPQASATGRCDRPRIRRWMLGAAGGAKPPPAAGSVGCQLRATFAPALAGARTML